MDDLYERMRTAALYAISGIHTFQDLHGVRLSGGAKGGVFETLFGRSFIHSGWREGHGHTEPDMVCVTDPLLSFEVKTGAHGNFKTGGLGAARSEISGKRKAYCSRHLFVASGRLLIFADVPRELWSAGTGVLAFGTLKKIPHIDLWDRKEHL